MKRKTKLTKLMLVLSLMLASFTFSATKAEEVATPSTNSSNVESNESILHPKNIGEIQGESHISPLVNKNVEVQNVYVTYVENKNLFYIADITPDNNPKTSNGIAVYKKNHGLTIGNTIKLTGKVIEHLGAGTKTKALTDLTTTQIEAIDIEKLGTLDNIPKPLLLEKDLKVPRKFIDNDQFKIFDPEEDAIDFWESIEGMVVGIENPIITGPQKHAEIYVFPKINNEKLNDFSALPLQPNDNPQRILLYIKDKNLVTKSGDYINGTIYGPVTYSFGDYKISTSLKDFKINDGGIKPEKTDIKFDENKLTIASYNIENFSANPKYTSDEKVNRIAKSIINNLNSPDIVTLVEVQDNSGPVDDGTTASDKSAQRLIDEIIAVGGIKYEYKDLAPKNNVDGGIPGGNIRVGFLYNPKRVSLKSVQRLGEESEDFKEVRKSLVGEFDFQGNPIMIVTNHLKSRRSDDKPFSKIQPPILHSEPARIKEAELIYNFLKMQVNKNPKLSVIMTGDFNEFEFKKPIKVLQGELFTDLVPLHPIGDRFSYFFKGSAQTLDHIIISNSLVDKSKFDMVHINSIFMEEHGRASDHDPVIVQLDYTKSTNSPEETYSNNSNTEIHKKSEIQINSHENKEEKLVSKNKKTPNTNDPISLYLATTSAFIVIGYISRKYK